MENIMTHIIKKTLTRVKTFIQGFNNDEEGQSTVEVMLLLFVAGLVIYALWQGGNDILGKLAGKIGDILGSTMSWFGGSS